MTPVNPPPIDESAWDEAAIKWKIGSLERIRGSAEKWVGTISTLVGVFATVVVFAGPSTFAEIEPLAGRIVVFVLLAIAAVLAGAAILVGALAAQGISKVHDNWNGRSFRVYTHHEGNLAARQLEWSRWLGSCAAALVLVAGLVGVLLGISGPTVSAPTVIAVTDSGTVCGEVGTASDGSLTVGGNGVGQVLSITQVDACGTKSR